MKIPEISLEEMRGFHSVRELAGKYGVSRHGMSMWLQSHAKDYTPHGNWAKEFGELPAMLALPDIAEWFDRRGWWIPFPILRVFLTRSGRPIMNRRLQLRRLIEEKGMSAAEAWNEISNIRREAGLPPMNVTAFHHRLVWREYVES